MFNEYGTAVSKGRKYDTNGNPNSVGTFEYAKLNLNPVTRDFNNPVRKCTIDTV